MKIGYACLNETIKAGFKTCRLATFREQGVGKIKELAIYNFEKTKEILEWNAVNGILFYRMTSEMVPLATHPEMKWQWWEDPDILRLTSEIKQLKEKEQMRLSAHPGQYSVLNSPNPEIVARAVEDLEYHDRVLNLVGGEDMILHVGGAYGNKSEAMERFVENYRKLSHSIKEKLRLENDDKTFTLEEVVEISHKTGVPICLDIHHHNCNPSQSELPVLVDEVFKSWEKVGAPKIHISTGKTSATDRSHHDYVSDADLDFLLQLLQGREADLMFETKKKDLSVLQQMERLKRLEIWNKKNNR